MMMTMANLQKMIYLVIMNRKYPQKVKTPKMWLKNELI